MCPEVRYGGDPSIELTKDMLLEWWLLRSGLSGPWLSIWRGGLWEADVEVEHALICKF